MWFSQDFKFGLTFEINVIHCINRMKMKSHMIISIFPGETFDITHYSVKIKALSKLGIQEYLEKTWHSLLQCLLPRALGLWTWTSLVAQLVQNLPVMQKTWVRSLGWEDPLGKGMATHSSILTWRIPWTIIHGVQRVGHAWATSTFIKNLVKNA